VVADPARAGLRNRQLLVAAIRYTQPYDDRTRINRPTKAYDHNTTDYIYYEPTLKPTQCVFIFFPPHIF